MNPRKRNEVERALIKKGFRKSQNDHSKFVYHLKNGKKTSVWTKTSHGSSHREISPTNLGKMARQCKLSSKDFVQLIECPMNQSIYEKILESELI